MLRERHSTSLPVATMSGPANWRSQTLRRQTGRLLRSNVPVTSCANCRQTFDDGQAHYKWDKTMHSLLELVAENLVEDDA